MKISEMAKNKVLFSAEVFPPKKNSPKRVIYDTLQGMKDINFDFISVTLGAGGSLENAEITCEYARIMKEEYNIEPMVHIPAYAFSEDEVKMLLDKLDKLGVENILALRGDRNPDKEPKMDFPHASDLTAFIAEYNSNFDICGGCYPEGHPTAYSLDADIKNLKKKVDAGATHLVSQLFFDNKSYFEFIDKAHDAGINVPIEAGIMPVTNAKQIERMVSMCGASLPPKFSKMISRFGSSSEAIVDAGVAYAIDQIVDLLAHGVDGIHLYTMNNAKVARRIYDAVSSLINV
jgi:methylenetetrahydrofolate reductase (NADPH)